MAYYNAPSKRMIMRLLSNKEKFRMKINDDKIVWADGFKVVPRGASLTVTLADLFKSNGFDWAAGDVLREGYSKEPIEIDHEMYDVVLIARRRAANDSAAVKQGAID